jgi:UDP-glucose 4-epimerase
MQDDYEVYGIDIVEPYDMDPFTSFFQWDIRDPVEDFLFDMGDMPMEYDTIIHLAALVRVNESVQNPREYYETNVNGTINVLMGLTYKNFVFASTGAAENPISPYAVSKIAAEHCVREHCFKNDIRHTVFRFYNVIGSAGYPPTNPDGLFYNLIKAKQTGEFNLFGNDYKTPDGTPVRDYVHVVEICYSLELATRKPACVPGAEFISLVENLGHGKGHSVKEMAETFQLVNNCKFKINYCQKRPGDLESSVLKNVSPYMRELVTFEELMKI